MGLLKNTKDALFNLPIINDLCFEYSKWRLQKRIHIENDLDDILDTTGTWEKPHGAFKGLGSYRTIQILQTRDEIYSVAEEIKSHAPSTILEIGAGWGGTLYLWSRFIDSINTIISIDIDYRGKTPLIESFEEFSGKEIICIEGSSHDMQVKRKVENTLSGNKIDFLYIDADHSYDAVKKDFNMYKPMVAEGGIIGLHDVNNKYVDVPEFWSELEKEYNYKKINKGAGTGLIYL